MITALLLTLCTSVSAMAAPSGTVACPSASTIQSATYVGMSQLFNINVVVYQLSPTQMTLVVMPGALPTRAQARAVLNTATASWTATATPETVNGETNYACTYQPGAQQINFPLTNNLIIWGDSPNAPITKSAMILGALAR